MEEVGSIYTKIAKEEGVSLEKLERLIRDGRVVIPKNFRRDIEPIAIGEGMSTKVNVNVGTSRDYINVDEEREKAKVAVEHGADTIMDLSTGGDLDEIRRRILKEVRVPVGTVPIYQAGIDRGVVVEMDSDDMFRTVIKHGKDGVDFVTIHAGVNLNSLERLRKSDRILNVVSRGGAFSIAWMLHNGEENPFYAEFDYLLDIAKEYNLAISLGDGMRSGCIADATDLPKFTEFITLSELAKKARANGVQVIVEGPGHVPLDQIEVNVKAIKHLAGHVPIYLLGPQVTDVAPGYDHITTAIGGAVAGMYGADFLCMVSPSEHLALPTINDIKEGTIATKIAAHAADIVKSEGARNLDKKMAYARKELDWKREFEIAINGELAREMRNGRRSESDACSMCGDLCAIRMANEYLRD